MDIVCAIILAIGATAFAMYEIYTYEKSTCPKNDKQKIDKK